MKIKRFGAFFVAAVLALGGAAACSDDGGDGGDGGSEPAESES